jgi:hypothetical protein
MVIMLTATVRASWSEASPCDVIQKNAPQRNSEQGQTDEDHPPNPEAGQDRPVDRTRRPVHHIELVRLERDDQA